VTCPAGSSILTRPLDIADQSPNLEQLFSETAGDLERYFSRRHGVGETVQDLVQETFLQMARGLREGRKFKCARGYLFGIARHLSQAAWTQRSNNVVVPLEPANNEVAAPVSDERVGAARETISALSSLHREILDLRFSQGLSYAEIAEALEIPVGTVRSRLHHAIAEVRSRLDSDGHFSSTNL
jgi:RNA polymerase sigma-70 factor, ECF subfamily